MSPAKNDLGIWMPLYIGDFLADTLRLTMEAIGFYLHLLMDYWRNGPLPNDIKVLMGIGRMCLPTIPMISGCVNPFDVKDGQAAPDAHYANMLDMLLQQYFTLGDDGKWHHSRLDAELAKWTDKKQRASEHGKKGAKARWVERPSTMPEHMPEQYASPSPSPSPIQITVGSKQADSLLFSLRDGSAYEATGEQIADWRREFPNINVRHALLKMQAMQRANPRYSRESIETAILRWLGAEKPPAAAQEDEHHTKFMPSQPVAVCTISDDRESYLRWLSTSETYRRNYPWDGPIPTAQPVSGPADQHR